MNGPSISLSKVRSEIGTFNVRAYGAVPDGRGYASGAAIQSGTTAITLAGLTVADAGKSILVAGAGTAGGNLATTIQSAAAGTATLASAAGTTVTDAAVSLGTDNTAAFQAAIDAAVLHSTLGTIVVPTDISLDYLVAGTLRLYSGVQIVAEGGPHQICTPDLKAAKILHAAADGTHLFVNDPAAVAIGGVFGARLVGLRLYRVGKGSDACHWVYAIDGHIDRCQIHGFDNAVYFEKSTRCSATRSYFRYCTTGVRTSIVESGVGSQMIGLEYCATIGCTHDVVLEGGDVGAESCTMFTAEACSWSESYGCDVGTGCTAVFSKCYDSQVPPVEAAVPQYRAGVNGWHYLVPTDTAEGHTTAVTVTVDGSEHTVTHTNGAAETVATLCDAIVTGLTGISGLTVTDGTTHAKVRPTTHAAVCVTATTAVTIRGSAASISIRDGSSGGSVTRTSGGSFLEVGHCYMAAVDGQLVQNADKLIKTYQQAYAAISGALPAAGLAHGYWNAMVRTTGTTPWSLVYERSRVAAFSPMSNSCDITGTYPRAILGGSELNLWTDPNYRSQLRASNNWTGADLFFEYVTDAEVLRTNLAIYGDGDVVVGEDALATNATKGFLGIPTCAGAPTGTVRNYGKSTCFLVADSANHVLYGNIAGTWYNLTTPA